MTTAAGPCDAYRRHLERFGHELRVEVELLRTPADRLARLTDQPLPLGGFGEAFELSERHLAAAEHMYGLVQALRTAVGFARDVTGVVAASYRPPQTVVPVKG